MLFELTPQNVFERVIEKHLAVSNIGTAEASLDLRLVTPSPEYFTLDTEHLELDSGASATVRVGWRPAGDAACEMATANHSPSAPLPPPPVTTAYLLAECEKGDPIYIPLAARLPRGQAAFLEKSIDFGVINVGRSSSMVCTLQNKSSEGECYFEMQQDNPEIEVDQVRGSIPAGEQIPIVVTLVASRTVSLNSKLSYRIIGGEPATIALRGLVESPCVVVSEVCDHEQTFSVPASATSSLADSPAGRQSAVRSTASLAFQGPLNVSDYALDEIPAAEGAGPSPGGARPAISRKGSSSLSLARHGSRGRSGASRGEAASGGPGTPKTQNGEVLTLAQPRICISEPVVQNIPSVKKLLISNGGRVPADVYIDASAAPSISLMDGLAGESPAGQAAVEAQVPSCDIISLDALLSRFRQMEQYGGDVPVRQSLQSNSGVSDLDGHASLSGQLGQSGQSGMTSQPSQFSATVGEAGDCNAAMDAQLDRLAKRHQLPTFGTASCRDFSEYTVHLLNNADLAELYPEYDGRPTGASSSRARDGGGQAENGGKLLHVFVPPGAATTVVLSILAQEESERCREVIRFFVLGYHKAADITAPVPKPDVLVRDAVRDAGEALEPPPVEDSISSGSRQVKRSEHSGQEGKGDRLNRTQKMSAAATLLAATQRVTGEASVHKDVSGNALGNDLGNALLVEYQVVPAVLYPSVNSINFGVKVSDGGYKQSSYASAQMFRELYEAILARIQARSEAKGAKLDCEDAHTLLTELPFMSAVSPSGLYSQDLNLVNQSPRQIEFVALITSHDDKLVPGKLYSLNQSFGVIQPYDTLSLRMFYSPTSVGVHAAKLKVYYRVIEQGEHGREPGSSATASTPLDLAEEDVDFFVDKGFVKYPLVTILLQATAVYRTLSFSSTFLTLPNTVVGQPSRIQFYVYNIGYKQVTRLGIVFPPELSKILFSVCWPLGNRISHLIRCLPVIITFISSSPMSFLSRIAICDEDGQPYYVQLGGNCIATDYQATEYVSFNSQRLVGGSMELQAVSGAREEYGFYPTFEAIRKACAEDEGSELLKHHGLSKNIVLALESLSATSLIEFSDYGRQLGLDKAYSELQKAGTSALTAYELITAHPEAAATSGAQGAVDASPAPTRNGTTRAHERSAKKPAKQVSPALDSRSLKKILQKLVLGPFATADYPHYPSANRKLEFYWHYLFKRSVPLSESPLNPVLPFIVDTISFTDCDTMRIQMIQQTLWTVLGLREGNLPFPGQYTSVVNRGSPFLRWCASVFRKGFPLNERATQNLPGADKLRIDFLFNAYDALLTHIKINGGMVNNVPAALLLAKEDFLFWAKYVISRAARASYTSAFQGATAGTPSGALTQRQRPGQAPSAPSALPASSASPASPASPYADIINPADTVEPNLTCPLISQGAALALTDMLAAVHSFSHRAAWFHTLSELTRVFVVNLAGDERVLERNISRHRNWHSADASEFAVKKGLYDSVVDKEATLSFLRLYGAWVAQKQHLPTGLGGEAAAASADEAPQNEIPDEFAPPKNRGTPAPELPGPETNAFAFLRYHANYMLSGTEFLQVVVQKDYGAYQLARAGTGASGDPGQDSGAAGAPVFSFRAEHEGEKLQPLRDLYLDVSSFKQLYSGLEFALLILSHCPQLTGLKRATEELLAAAVCVAKCYLDGFFPDFEAHDVLNLLSRPQLLTEKAYMSLCNARAAVWTEILAFLKTECGATPASRCLYLFGSAIKAPAVQSALAANHQLLFSILYQLLPACIPAQTLRVTCALGEATTQPIDFSNPLRTPVRYTCSLLSLASNALASCDFKLATPSITIEPQGKASVEVTFLPKFNKPCMTLVVLKAASDSPGQTGMSSTTSRRSQELPSTPGVLLTPSVIALAVDPSDNAPLKLYECEGKCGQQVRVAIDLENQNDLDAHYAMAIEESFLPLEQSVFEKAPAKTKRGARASSDGSGRSGRSGRGASLPGPYLGDVSASLPAFRLNDRTVTVRARGRTQLAVYYTPTHPGAYVGTLRFDDPHFGAFSYELRGYSLLPEVADTLDLSCLVSESKVFEYALSAVVGERPSGQTGQLRPILQPIDHNVSLEPRVDDSGSGPVLTLSYSPKAYQPGVYAYRCILISETLTRTLSILLDLKKKKEDISLELSAPAREEVSQRLPVRNEGDQEAQYQVFLSTQSPARFRVNGLQCQRYQPPSPAPTSRRQKQHVPEEPPSLPSGYSAAELTNAVPLTVKPHGMGFVTVTFRPEWICSTTASLIVYEPASDTVNNVYALTCVGSEPLSSGTITLETEAMTRATHLLTVVNDEESSPQPATASPALPVPPTPPAPTEYRIYFQEEKPAFSLSTSSLNLAPQTSQTIEVYGFSPCSGQSKNILFVQNARTNTYRWYEVTLHVSPRECAGEIRLSAPTHRPAEALVHIDNPCKDRAAACSVEVMNVPEGLLSFQRSVTIPAGAGTSGSPPFAYSVVFTPESRCSYRGVLIFNSQEIGEFWYVLDLSCTELSAETHHVTCLLGEQASIQIPVSNSQPRPVSFLIGNSNPTAFSLLPTGQLTVPALGHEALKLIYRPTRVGTVEKTAIHLQGVDPQVTDLSEYMGNPGSLPADQVVAESVHLVEGMGQMPEEQPVTRLTAVLNTSRNGIVTFKNPFLTSARLTFSFTNTPELVFSLASRGEVTLQPFSDVQVPFIYTPKHLQATKTSLTVSVRASGDSTVYRFVYPIEAVPEVAYTETFLTLRIPARTTANRTLSVPYKIDADPRDVEVFLEGDESSENFQLARRSVKLSLSLPRAGRRDSAVRGAQPVQEGELEASQIGQPPRALPRIGEGAPMQASGQAAAPPSPQLSVSFHPMKPFTCDASLVVSVQGGGRYRFPVQLCGESPKSEGLVTIEMPGNTKEGVHELLIQNVINVYSEYKAYFTPSSSTRLSVEPASGLLEPGVNVSGAPKYTTLRIHCSPGSSVARGQLVVETKEVMFLWDVITGYKRYVPPIGVARVEN